MPRGRVGRKYQEQAVEQDPIERVILRGNSPIADSAAEDLLWQMSEGSGCLTECAGDHSKDSPEKVKCQMRPSKDERLRYHTHAQRLQAYVQYVVLAREADPNSFVNELPPQIAGNAYVDPWGRQWIASHVEEHKATALALKTIEQGSKALVKEQLLARLQMRKEHKATALALKTIEPVECGEQGSKAFAKKQLLARLQMRKASQPAGKDSDQESYSPSRQAAPVVADMVTEEICDAVRQQDSTDSRQLASGVVDNMSLLFRLMEKDPVQEKAGSSQCDQLETYSSAVAATCVQYQ